MFHAFNEVDVDLAAGRAVRQPDGQRHAEQELTVVGGIELRDVIGGDDAEQLAAFKPQADVKAVAAHLDCSVPVDFEFYWHVEAVVFRGDAGIYGGGIRV